ncbi:MAG TPA: aldehyde dehydrogenase family protein [Allosphingosinicella sp.]|nr:aldehyde dehydrogenase family protein [Allosphingosinicella sp.]
MGFKLTYSTMFDPPPEMHEHFERALDQVMGRVGATHDLYIQGADQVGGAVERRHSPIDRRLLLGEFAVAGADEVTRAMDAARNSFDRWRHTPADQRVALLRRVAALIEERVYHIAAALVLEVGKNRLEALGEVQETADFFALYADDYEQHAYYEHVLPDDPLPDYASHNRSVMRPYGAWVVIAPFNFPFALAGGPVAAALVTGNTVVLKGSEETPWAGRLLADCLHDAGVPPGVFNYINGPGAVGEAMIAHHAVGGVTFTGSYATGMSILRRLADKDYPRPCISEMGGKNACIVTKRADLERAASGIVRSAYGMSGQKCSALSRLYVEAPVADELSDRIAAAAAALKVGDPRRKEVWMGPVTTEAAYARYPGVCEQLTGNRARLVTGGQRLAGGELASGFFVEPVLAEAEADHPLFAREMFLPAVMMARVSSREEAMARANDSPFGLTAGVYGDDDDVRWFQDRIEAGVTYANRPQGATTGAWPGYQPFGGWKGSSSTGKGIASFYYLAQYQREQSQTVVDRP